MNNKAAEQGGFDLSKSTVYHSTNAPSKIINDLSPEAKAGLILKKGLGTRTKVLTGVEHGDLGSRAYVSAGGAFGANVFERSGKTTLKATGLKERGFVDLVDTPHTMLGYDQPGYVKSLTPKQVKGPEGPALSMYILSKKPYIGKGKWSHYDFKKGNTEVAY